MKKIYCALALSLVLSLVVITESLAQNFNFGAYKLPAKMELCGEKIPLDDPEIREKAEREFYLLLQQPGQIMLYIKRSGKYFPTFERIIKEAGLPDDLKYLSVAESALYQSQSSKGAVGLWQFMEGTARSHGLRVDKFVDERRNVEKSTYAAMKYLKNGYSAHKSWFLTFAGYNMGNAGISRALDYQFGESFFDLYLNEETSRYIFRIAVIKEIMSNPAKYGFSFPKDEQYKPVKTKIITVDSSISDVSNWAKANKTSYKYVKLLNPWILERSLPAPKSGEKWEIEVPEENK